MSTHTPAAFPPIPGSEPLIRNVDAAPAYWLVDVLWIVLADGPWPTRAPQLSTHGVTGLIVSRAIG